MRVISGTVRGRKLKEPADEKIRPTTDMVKESIFNIIQFDIEGRKVLDLFAGTGQLGIEALSRGAKSVTFVDEAAVSIALVRDNLRATQLSGGEIVRSDALTFLDRQEKFDVIFLDPPYESGLLDKALKKIIAFDILHENGIIICESMADKALPEVSPPYEKGKEYRYGKIKITLYSRAAL